MAPRTLVNRAQTFALTLQIETLVLPNSINQYARSYNDVCVSACVIVCESACDCV
eukprot:m.765036 g.765036  ORF g.765036 m.765036 type:complete len:55 (+) comp23219_c0_seq2:122-286(+)